MVHVLAQAASDPNWVVRVIGALFQVGGLFLAAWGVNRNRVEYGKRPSIRATVRSKSQSFRTWLVIARNSVGRIFGYNPKPAGVSVEVTGALAINVALTATASITYPSIDQNTSGSECLRILGVWVSKLRDDLNTTQLQIRAVTDALEGTHQEILSNGQDISVETKALVTRLATDGFGRQIVGLVLTGIGAVLLIWG